MPSMKHIAIARDGSLWGIGKLDDSVLTLYGDAGYMGWITDRTGKAETVAPESFFEAWCINQAHEIWHATDAHTQTGTQWTKVATASGLADARTISVGVKDGTVWYADMKDGALYRRENQGWVKDPVGRATLIAAVSKSEVWCVNTAGAVYHLSGRDWKQEGGVSGAKMISVGQDGTIWYGKADGSLYWLESGSWHKDATAKAVAVSVQDKNRVVCINAAGEAFGRNPQGAWEKIVEHGPDGDAWHYTVMSGDTLATVVASKYHTNNWGKVNAIVEQVRVLSNLPDVHKIKPGDMLTMPAVSAS